MRAANFAMSSMHSEMVQKERDALMAEFFSATCRVLITTDACTYPRAKESTSNKSPLSSTMISQRGSHNNREDYIHRIGRAGRVDRKSIAISLVTVDDVRIPHDI
ncbi:hypothetical protein K503DRAFT_837175, partial [Rhizopogon vinicolor AM-OR11-026]